MKTLLILLLLASNAYAGMGFTKTTQSIRVVGKESWDDPQRSNKNIMDNLQELTQRRKLVEEVNKVLNDAVLADMLTKTHTTDQGVLALENKLIEIVSSGVDKTAQYVVDGIKELTARRRVIQIINEYKKDPVLTEMLEDKHVSEQAVKDLEARATQVLTGATVICSSEIMY